MTRLCISIPSAPRVLNGYKNLEQRWPLTGWPGDLYAPPEARIGPQAPEAVGAMNR